MTLQIYRPTGEELVAGGGWPFCYSMPFTYGCECRVFPARKALLCHRLHRGAVLHSRAYNYFLTQSHSIATQQVQLQTTHQLFAAQWHISAKSLCADDKARIRIGRIGALVFPSLARTLVSKLRRRQRGHRSVSRRGCCWVDT